MQNLNVYKLKLKIFISRFILNKEIIEYDVKNILKSQPLIYLNEVLCLNVIKSII